MSINGSDADDVAVSTIADLAAQVPGAPSSGGTRLLVGLVGEPGAGKSTTAAALVETLNRRDGGGWTLLGMDGFHLSNAVLLSLDRRARKGAPDTFDVSGFVNALNRIRSSDGTVIYLPVFHREIEESIAAEGAIGADIRGVVVEGNYLLHDDHGWQAVRPLLDACWYVQSDPVVRRERLIVRASATYGSREAGEHWVRTVDEPNAALIARGRSRADRVVRVADLA